MLALLRKKLAEFDAASGESRLILSADQIADLIRLFLADTANEARLMDRVDADIKRIVEIGFLRRLRGSEDRFEVRRILKSFVDAVTALLVPRANFNKAAGAAAGERSIETYFFGRYKSERGEPGLSSKPVSLRGPDSFSVLLARFFNEALAQQVTIAQVFWAKAPQ